jgi:xanthine dehydrogenase accessory factor
MSDRDWGVSDTDVLASVRDLLRDGRPGVLATVVGVEGRSYRRPGAKMVVEAGGDGRGHLTAGCLEDAVLDLAAEVMEAGEPRIETYDMTDDGDDVWGLGVGCDGVIDVLVEPIGTRLQPLIKAFDAGEPIAVLRVLEGDAPAGATAYYRGGEVRPEPPGVPEWLPAALSDPAEMLLEAGDADAVDVETDAGSARVFVEGVRPAPRLVVFGSGHDVGPVVDLAKKNGFRVTVVGFRGAVDLAGRFTGADEHVSTSPGRIDRDLDFDGSTYAVVMTHNFVDDRLTVETLLDASVPYVGLMGPRDRFEEMLAAFESEGRAVPEAETSPVYTPVGLDLGSGSPYGIATSVVAEVLAVHNDRSPGHLSKREGPIHDRVDVDPPDAR